MRSAGGSRFSCLSTREEEITSEAAEGVVQDVVNMPITDDKDDLSWTSVVRKEQKDRE